MAIILPAVLNEHKCVSALCCILILVNDDIIETRFIIRTFDGNV
jgi:hypothetical protein